jgi:hypothetical protein
MLPMPEVNRELVSRNTEVIEALLTTKELDAARAEAADTDDSLVERALHIVERMDDQQRRDFVTKFKGQWSSW